jgi:deoxycytidine triphosphate deaminase
MPHDHTELYDGSTTLARLGVTSHMGSMLISSGSQGKLILEIFNASDIPFLLEYKMRIGLLFILKLNSAVERLQQNFLTYKGESQTGLVFHNPKILYRKRT